MTKFNWYAFTRDLMAIVGRAVDESQARQVRRWLVAHNTIRERYCSEDMSDSRRSALEHRETDIEAHLARFFGEALARFDGDPRGATAKLVKPDTAHSYVYFAHDMGGDFIYAGPMR